jgi:hypothetical protein
MPTFTIETTYHLPVYRHRSYEAGTIEEACKLAIEDDDWSDEKRDYESAGETYVSGAWQGHDAAYRGCVLPVPSHYAETIQRKADHFEVILKHLKNLADFKNIRACDRSHWLRRAQIVAMEAEAILAGDPDPDPERAPFSIENRTHVLLQLEEARVRDQMPSILETDPSVTQLTGDSITDADIHAACLHVAAETDLSEERGAAEFRAALAAIREAERRRATSG